MKERIKIAVASPEIRLCDPTYNADLCAQCAREADGNGADVIVFPELTLSGATAGDLYRQELLLSAAECALSKYIDNTASLSVMSFIGLPLSVEGSVYNAVACVSEGEILGISLSGESARNFSPSPARSYVSEVCGRKVELGRNLIYTDADTRANIFVKVGEDDAFSGDGVNLIVNPSAVMEYVGLAKARREYASNVSAALGVAFVIAGAGAGESGTDGVFASARLVAQGGEIISEAELFSDEILYADLSLKKSRRVESKEHFDTDEVLKSPFVPEDREQLSAACSLAFNIQSRALAARIKRSYSKTAVIGVSGGLDSTLAVLVAARAMDILGYGRDKVIAITMPCFGTTERTKGNALLLAEKLGCTVRTIDIKAAVNQHFADISHDIEKYDVVYENAQARERTQILMDVANAEGGLVIGTGDLSELALGFATYNGDHMSMYCVNGSVPKTLMRAMIRHLAEKAESGGEGELARVLLDVVDTPISPELLPTENGENAQHTESIVGPYELHDFFLYYTVKYGHSPSRILKMATELFDGYSEEEIKRYLDTFVRRFFTQQFKRSCLPDGPRVTEISLSPRGAWQMPSDVGAALWRSDISER